MALAAAHPDDAALYCDVLATVDPTPLMPALMADPPRAVEIAHSMADLTDTHRHPERGEVDRLILWLFAVARHAAGAGELHLLEECCNGAFTWDGLWDQWRPQDEIRPWRRTLAGDPAGLVAGALREHPDCARHFASLADDVRVDHRIRSAIAGGPAVRPVPPAPAVASRPAASGGPGARARPTAARPQPPSRTAGHSSAGDGPRAGGASRTTTTSTLPQPRARSTMLPTAWST